tara:strand:- start:10949 stop:11335 length:387 start_codon:yes stop_codon:yes gene_type:complete
MIKNYNFRTTPFREKILSLFQSKEYALSLEEIENGLDQFDRITLYRTLKLFQDQGIIHLVNSGNIKKYALCKEECTFEKHDHHHHVHFTCDKCQQTECIASKSLDITLEGYQIKELELNVSGFCKNCL